MRKFVAIIALAVIVVLLGGTAFLAVWDIPTPTTPIENVIPDSKLAK
ncbi:MAG TPA: hypothetical protein VKT70_01000 [Stellaceae bacterium]|nr:hypothetical protein [Stellaceae bacterium]